jgi:ABC-2 type transport system permease protein
MVVFMEELRRARGSASTYVLMSLFFLITGALYLSVFFQASVEQQRYSPLQLFWELQWLPNLIWVPLLTMRLIAPERRLGLLESTLATPTTPAAIVLGKYLSVYVLYLIGWASVGLYMLITRFSGLTHTELAYIFSPSAVWGGALFCISSGGMFLSLGLLCSSLTRNTILAGGLTVCLMLLYMLLPTMFGQTTFRHVGFLKPFSHLENLSAYVSGAIELSMVVAYFILTLVILFTAMLSIERKSE